MSKAKLAGVVWLLCLLSLSGTFAQEKLTVGVFYETLCPDSIRFITTQLYPAFKQLGGNGNQYFNIDFVPYGKATTTEGPTGNFTFVCQHGARECEGNRVHACALKYLPEESRAAFINCSMSSTDPPSAGPACATTLGLDFARVEQCITEDGSQLLADNGVRTHDLEPALYYVPWILYNGQFSEADLEASQANFLNVLCAKLGGNGPNVCRNGADFTLSVYYETLCPDSIRFITTQLFPTFVNFGGFDNEYFNIDFVPYGKANTTEGPNGTYSFVCQHGNAECEGNKMHACALKYLPAASAASFINCSMSASIPPAAGPYCAEKLGLDYTRVESCIVEDGPALLAANGNRTHSLDPALYYVPWILYNGVFSESDLADSQSNFTDLICTKLGSNGPTQCNNTMIN